MSNCITCRQTKVQHTCGLCEESLCRSCAIFLEEGTFPFLETLADELKHSYYCQGCHVEHVEPALEQYQNEMEQARGVFFFFTTHKKPVQTLKKAKVNATVKACIDRDETILRLAFQAVQQGFNAIVGAEVVCEKVRANGYQKSNWKGHGTPALVDAERLERPFMSDY